MPKKEVRKRKPWSPAAETRWSDETNAIRDYARGEELRIGIDGLLDYLADHGFGAPVAGSKKVCMADVANGWEYERNGKVKAARKALQEIRLHREQRSEGWDSATDALLEVEKKLKGVRSHLENHTSAQARAVLKGFAARGDADPRSSPARRFFALESEIGESIREAAVLRETLRDGPLTLCNLDIPPRVKNRLLRRLEWILHDGGHRQVDIVCLLYFANGDSVKSAASYVSARLKELLAGFPDHKAGEKSGET